MTTRRNLLTAAPAAGALFTLGTTALTVSTAASAQGTESVGPIWRSQSLREQPVTNPDGIIATAETFTVNERMGAGRKVAAQVAPGIYAR